MFLRLKLIERVWFYRLYQVSVSFSVEYMGGGRGALQNLMGGLESIDGGSIGGL